MFLQRSLQKGRKALACEYKLRPPQWGHFTTLAASPSGCRGAAALERLLGVVVN